MRTATGTTIRAARADDAASLTALMLQSAAYQGDYAPMLRGYAVTEAQIANDIFAVAEQNGAIVGFYSLTNRDEPEIDLMFVADALQGSGLGRDLIDHLVIAARNRGWTSLKIASHPPSEGFYLRMGAVRVGTEPRRGRISWDRPILTLSIGDQ